MMGYFYKILLFGLFLAISLGVNCCFEKSDIQTHSREIWEERTERYLDRVATDACMEIDNAQRQYEEALKQQNEIDTVAVKDTMRLYESRYLEARSVRDTTLQIIWEAEEKLAYNDPIFEKYKDIYRQVLSITEPYERAAENLELARGKGACEAKEAIERGNHNLDVVVSYLNLLRIPKDERSEADNRTLRRVYDFCAKAENKGWNSGLSSRLVEHMENLDK